MQFCERIGYSCLATILLSSAKMSLIWNSGTVRDTPLDKQWPACCNSGCQIWAARSARLAASSRRSGALPNWRCSGSSASSPAPSGSGRWRPTPS
uniref:Secreted protein n=1 Tax=Macrostomum lignano TaxID=282301 RepID=A0A1I8FGC9_9PLAT